MKKIIKKAIPGFIWSWYHFSLALFGALLYGFPSRKIKVIGVTGTKGKSTTVMLAGKILGEVENSNSKEGININPPPPSFEKGGGNSANKVGWISSLTVNDGQKEILNPYHMTMPGRFFIQKTLAQMVKNGCKYALVEVTSEGIKQHRHRFIEWTGAVFTNLAPEHLEAHGGFEKYRAAKCELFRSAAKNDESFGVYNLDDEEVQHFLDCQVGKRYGYGVSSKFKVQSSKLEFKKQNLDNIITVDDVQLNANGSAFEINGVKFKANLLGEFNVRNCATAITIGAACGVSLEAAARALEKIKAIPGRLEIIDEGQDFTVVVDLAHTPDSFEKVFELFNKLRNQHPSLTLPSFEGREDTPRIISVFGSAGGGRDKWKRPELGRIACENSDAVILCNEDPYNESPGGIVQDIASGCKKIQPEIVLDRKEAIARGVALAQKGDILLVLGKGTEQTMVIGDKKIKWDDRAVVREILKNQSSA